MSDPYGGRKPGCFDITVLTVAAWLIAIAVCVWVAST